MKKITGIFLLALTIGLSAKASSMNTKQIHCQSTEQSDWVLDGIFGSEQIISSIGDQQTVYNYKGKLGSSISHLIYSAGANDEHRIFIEDIAKDSSAVETSAFYYRQSGTIIDFKCVISAN